MMDTALHISGDLAVDDNGQPYRIAGEEAVRQQLYILLSARKGAFLYDRALGSDIFQIDLSAPDCIPLIEAKARHALAGLPDTEIAGVTVEEGIITVHVLRNQIIYEVILR